MRHEGAWRELSVPFDGGGDGRDDPGPRPAGDTGEGMEVL